MKNNLFLVSWLLMCTICIAAAEPRVSQQGLNQEACAHAKAADQKLNQVYQAILKDKAYADNPVFLKALRAAQRQWLLYRDAELEAQFPGTDKQELYGSVYPMCECTALENLTRARIQELEVWQRGTTDGNVCAVSVKTN